MWNLQLQPLNILLLKSTFSFRVCLKQTAQNCMSLDEKLFKSTGIKKNFPSRFTISSLQSLQRRRHYFKDAIKHTCFHSIKTCSNATNRTNRTKGDALLTQATQNELVFSCLVKFALGLKSSIWRRGKPTHQLWIFLCCGKKKKKIHLDNKVWDKSELIERPNVELSRRETQSEKLLKPQTCLSCGKSPRFISWRILWPGMWLHTRLWD